MTAEPPAHPAGAPPAGAGATTDPIAALADRLEAIAPPSLVVAVSGGSDSTALLLGAADWAARAPGRALLVATVDHGLRPEAPLEAARVAHLAAGLGLPHRTLRWGEAPGRGNLAAAARDARRARLAETAREIGAGAVALGHTLDDRAETLLMRLARGSGLDGLAALREVSRRGGIRWLRPALGLRREALRAALRARGARWIEDPSNDDATRDRPRIRRALAALDLDPARLAGAAERLAEDADHLAAEALALAPRILALGPAGEIEIDRAGFAAAPRPLTRRLLARLLRDLAAAEHPPRAAALADWLDLIASGRTAPPRTLAGCVLDARRPGRARLWREARALPPPVPARPGAVWDGRWALGPPSPDSPEWPDGARLGPLGAGRAPAEAPAPFRRSPAGARRAAPALFLGETLLALPHAGFGTAPALEDRLAAALGLAPARSRRKALR